MSLWGKIKKAAKAVTNVVVQAARVVSNAVRTLVRVTVRILWEITYRIINLALLLYGGERKLRLHFVILRDPVKKAPLATVTDVEMAFRDTEKILKASADVRVIGFGKPHITFLEEDAPDPALDVISGPGGFFKSEWASAGAFYSAHIAGWNVVPLTFTFPITVFVVRSITESPSGDTKRGASFGPFTDYVVVVPASLTDGTTVAHELGHSCIPTWHHPDAQGNLMHANSTRGTHLNGWQRFWFRRSRFVNVF